MEESAYAPLEATLKPLLREKWMRIDKTSIGDKLIVSEEVRKYRE